MVVTIVWAHFSFPYSLHFIPSSKAFFIFSVVVVVDVVVDVVVVVIVIIGCPRLSAITSRVSCTLCSFHFLCLKSTRGRTSVAR